MSANITVSDLSVSFRSARGYVPVVHGISFSIRPGETLALVGESGSGKSVTSMAIMKLLAPAPMTRIEGRAVVTDNQGNPVDLVALDEKQLRHIRGNRIAMIFQEPLTSLNPVHTVGDQIAEAIRFHERLSKAEARRRALSLLEQVGIPEPAKRLDTYPHELSGGMRQRVMIAIALAMEPDILIADEPTTALDVTVQAQILGLLRDLQRKKGMAILFITHNFGVVAEIADRVMVMYAGRIVEEGSVLHVLSSPRMPYTRGLLASVPRLEHAGLGQAELGTIPGYVPDPAAPPAGCAFHPRCAHNKPGICDVEPPELVEVRAGHQLRCSRWQELCLEGGVR
ncbi:oligopeptide transport system ATP-binding protein [Pseudomonas duriflava]|uniref:ABC-type dipeptide transporter n=1 Tax=Pseudomonas duriflava TaxID=459528 RepID=A0A562QCF3_9PSED|nr:ABC transporter ATP-binding protein [Pseudomonas duriflava]TWI53706.1 oligopeptide transport system ATP-binding protein [Pseudomonas duriflava]